MSKKDSGSKDASRSLTGSRALATRFYQLTLERRFAEAERMLERLKDKTRKNEWNRGYLQALNGMIVTKKSNDERYAFLANLDLENEEDIKKNRREFLNQIRCDFHTDYDRGFFMAWADLLRVILKVREKIRPADEAG